ncbi:MAG TPA: DUF4132 domain-containing protein [Steroidobacteraceae bacterium]
MTNRLEGVPAEWADLVLQKLRTMEYSPTGGGPSDWPERILNFVLTGRSGDVFDEIRDIRRKHALMLSRMHHAGDAEKDLYGNFGGLPADVCLRWSQAILAIHETGGFTHDLYFDLPKELAGLEAMFMHACGTQPSTWPMGREQPLTYRAIEKTTAAAGYPESAFMVSAFSTALGSSERLALITLMPDYADALDRHLESVRPHLRPTELNRRLHVLKLLKSAEPRTLDRVAEELVVHAGATSKNARLAADELIARCGAPIVAPLRAMALEGNPEQRLRALRLLRDHAKRHADAGLEEFARATARADSNASVQALEAEWQATAQDANEPPPLEYEIPVIDWSLGYSEDIEALLQAFAKNYDAVAAENNRKRVATNARNEAEGVEWRQALLENFSEENLASLRALLRDPAPAKRGVVYSNQKHGYEFADLQAGLGRAPGMTPEALFKILHFTGSLVGGADYQLWYRAPAAFDAMHARTGRPTLLELAQMLNDSGFEGAAILNNYCSRFAGGIARRWDGAAVWPYFAHYREQLIARLNQPDLRNYSFDRPSLFKAICTLPFPLPEMIDPLFDIALGTTRNERELAQQALARYPRRRERIVSALRDGRAEVRTVAAQWLGRAGEAEGVAPLAEAFAREKHDTTRGAMLDALEALGEPVEKYLDRDKLVAEARKSASKPLPAEIAWLPLGTLPEIRWAASGEIVPPELPRWMLAQACRAKSPEPNAILRKYCALFDAGDRERFGQWVLENWLHEDVVPISPEEAAKRAHTDAQQMHAAIAQWPQGYENSPMLGKTVVELTQMFLPGLLRQPAGSAIGSKGILAVAAACAAQRAAAPVARYIKEWYGTRAAQGKALIAMLAWIEHPTATQLMLAIGNRFRTRSFQEEASRQAAALAERRGWTLAELADRTMPGAGFDEHGVLELPAGDRTFTAKLLPDFTVELFNPDGKKIASLPESAKDSRKLVSAAKKELKSIVELQTDRLYEALCTGRDWSFGDWRAYLLDHPVVRHLLQRLVWIGTPAGQGPQVFRPLDDGTLTDCDDEAVTMPDDARVRLAHDSLLTPEQVGRWQQHLIDYEIRPPFQQLGKGTWSLPEALATNSAIEEFKGHMLEAFALRGRAQKLGYVRGTAEDGGWFYDYRKRFPTLGLEAQIRFSGNGLPEENRKVALIELSFSATGEASSDPVTLGSIPGVLLSECYNDLRLIAAEGTGFDPEWESKTG